MTICILIFFANAGLAFYMLFLDKLRCPDYGKAWNLGEVLEYQESDDFYTAIHGMVYDFTHFYRQQHADILGVQTTADEMLAFAGRNLPTYFPKPVTVVCRNLVHEPALRFDSLNHIRFKCCSLLRSVQS